MERGFSPPAVRRAKVSTVGASRRTTGAASSDQAAVDALGAAPAEAGEGMVRAFLDRLAEGEAAAHDGVGLGTEVVLTAPGAVGAALAWAGTLVHLATFATGSEARRCGRVAGPIELPSRRGPSIRRGPGGCFGARPRGTRERTADGEEGARRVSHRCDPRRTRPVA